MDVWKEFDHNIITHSAAHHLMSIDDLIGTHGYARVSDVARELNITRGSVSITLKSLKEAGLINQDENRHLRLSEAGQRLVDQIKAKRLLVKRLFAEVLGVDAAQAEIDACKMEHLVSSETARHIISLLKFIDSNAPAVVQFRDAMRAFDPSCSGQPQTCAACQTSCLAESLSK